MWYRSKTDRVLWPVMVIDHRGTSQSRRVPHLRRRRERAPQRIESTQPVEHPARIYGRWGRHPWPHTRIGLTATTLDMLADLDNRTI
jgi:hypothetical protein